MKTKITFFGVLFLLGALWACWSLAYQRGYSRGARDEFACWKQEPRAIKPGDSWVRILVGRRDATLLPGGKEGPPVIRHVGGPAVNIIPSNPLK